MDGLVLKGVGSFYTVLSGETQYVCKARGRFRKDGVTPVPGDRVEFTFDEESGRIAEILPRKNLLTRPAAANIDKLIIVISASVPQPDLYLTDKQLITCEMLGIMPIIVINKCDAGDSADADAVERQYTSAGYQVIKVSAKTGVGLDALSSQIKGNTCCFAGQSAVGKSSLLNALIPGLGLEVGGLSRKTDRGRHTTRHCELWQACSGAVLDTPGFSLYDIAEIEPYALAPLYPEMRLEKKCRYPECLHISEPDCAVKDKLNSGGIAPERYSRYKEFITELIDKRRHRYD